MGSWGANADGRERGPAISSGYAVAPEEFIKQRPDAIQLLWRDTPHPLTNNPAVHGSYLEDKGD